MKIHRLDYLQDAFGGFDPRNDHDAAVKFSLNILFLDKRFKELTCLLTDGHDIGGIEGEPGWIIERRDTGLSGEHRFYTDWPEGKHFRVRVDPTSFELAFPEIFLETNTLQGYVLKALDTYITQYPNDPDVAELILQLKG